MTARTPEPAMRPARTGWVFDQRYLHALDARVLRRSPRPDDLAPSGRPVPLGSGPVARGSGAAEGTSLSVPLPAGSGWGAP